MESKKKRVDISDTKLIVFLFAIVIVFSLIKGGIENSVEPVIEEPTQVIEPEAEEVVEQQPQAEEKITEPEEVITKPEEETKPGEEPLIFEVSLTKEKLMDPDSIKIKKATTVRWFNKDNLFYHNIVIYPADIKIPTINDVTAQSGNIRPGDYWEYVFDKPGEYAVKDIYSGTMRGQITAEVVSEILEKGVLVGKVYVE